MEFTGSAVYSGLGIHLDSKLETWERARKPLEQKLTNWYADYMRIPRSDDTKGVGAAKSDKARSVFVGLTRGKVRGARAKIKDALFGTGDKMPFDTKPTNPELEPYAEALEKILKQQLIDGDFVEVLSAGINTITVFGTGFIGGVFARAETVKQVTPRQDPITGAVTLEQITIEEDQPYFELFRTLDVIPDPDAKDADDGEGVFCVSWKSPHSEEVESWRTDPAYTNVSALAGLSAVADRSDGSQITDALRGIVQRNYNSDDGRIRVIRYFGRIKKGLLESFEREHYTAQDNAQNDKRTSDGPKDTPLPATAQKDDGTEATTDQTGTGDDKYVSAFVVMAGGIVIRAEESPWEDRPISRCVYEDAEHEMWGVGIAENNEPHQKILNAAFRLFLEGKALSLLPPMAIDRSKFMPSEDFKVRPGKVFKYRSGLTEDEKSNAIKTYPIVDVTNGWELLIELSERFADDDTGISKYTQGTDSRHLNNTATGISMIMNASSLPLKEVIQNIDKMWIEPAIEKLIEWDIEYLRPETVERSHGRDTAQAWATIQQHAQSNGIDGIMTWRATGASTMMAKEVLINKLQGFMAIASGNPVTAQLLDMQKLLKNIWDALDTGRESPVLDHAPAPMQGGAPMPQDAQGGGLPAGMAGQMPQPQAQPAMPMPGNGQPYGY